MDIDFESLQNYYYYFFFQINIHREKHYRTCFIVTPTRVYGEQPLLRCTHPVDCWLDSPMQSSMIVLYSIYVPFHPGGAQYRCCITFLRERPSPPLYCFLVRTAFDPPREGDRIELEVESSSSIATAYNTAT